jgi:HEAT repeat protein
MALAHAVDDGDPAVALGAIEALRKTGGPASVVGDAAGRQPLAEALAFPDRMVRVRAALALARARPTTTFHNHQNLMPVLSEALMLHGGARNALVADPDDTTSNLVATALRAEGYEVLTDASLFSGLDKVRRELPGIELICLASDMKEPPLTEALAHLRSEFRFANTPTLIMSKPGEREVVRDLVRADHRLAEIVPGDDLERIKAAVAAVSRAVGVTPIDPEMGVRLALETAEVLRLLALTDNPLFNVQDVEPALIAALATTDEKLRVALAQVLGFLPTTSAQEAIAGIALDENEPQEMRVSMFEALAEAAKARGNHLGSQSVQRIIAIAESEANMVIREAASQTLGALNLSGNPASVIIRNQYGG